MKKTFLLSLLLLLTTSLMFAAPLNEGFEGGVIPDNWTVLNVDGGLYQWEAQTLNPNTGTYAARVRYESSTLQNDDWLITPPLQVTSATTDEISFWMRTYSGTSADPWEVLISTTDTNPASFTMIDSGTGQLASYVQKTYSLDSYGDAIVYLAVRYIGSYDWYLYVDDFVGPEVVVFPPGAPYDPDPADDAVDVATTSVLSWTNGSGGTETVDVYFGTNEALVTAKDASVKVVDDLFVSTYDPGGMATLTDYYWLVVCKNSAGSTDGAVWSFTTAGDPLSGTYTIGPSGDYTTFGAAVNALTGNGINAPVTFDVAAGTYNEQITIPAIPGASAVNTVTFEADLTDDPPLLQFAATGTADNWVVLLDGAGWVTFKDISFAALSASMYGRVVVFQNGANNNSLIDNNLTGNLFNSSSLNNAIIYGDLGAPDSYNLIDGNVISDGGAGIYFNGGTTSYDIGNVVQNNIVENFYYYGIYMRYQEDTQILNNIVESSRYSTHYGIYMNYCVGLSEALKNIVNLNATTSNYVMYLSYCTGTASDPVLIANNMLSQGTGTGTVYGIYAYYDTYMNIYHNSINVTAGSATLGRGMYFNCSSTVGSNIDVRNNVIVNTGGGYTVDVAANAVTYNYITGMDYNDLYGTGTDLARWGSTTCTDLATWQTTSLLDANSLSIDPLFTSPTDLHANAIGLDDSCPLLPSVPDDIDGDVRPDPTDMGADEFTPASVAVFSVTPDPFDFGTVFFNTTATQLFTVTNLGGADGDVTGISISGTNADQFSLANLPSLPATIGVGGNTTFDVIYTPTLEGPVTADLIVVDNVTDVTHTIPLSGTGYDATVTTFPWAEDFAATSTPTDWQNTGPEMWLFSTSAGYGAGLAGDHTPGGGTNYAWIDGSSGIQDNALITPPLDPASLTAPTLSFWYFGNNTNTPGDVNTLYCDISIDGGAWTNIFTYYGDNPNWLNQTINLSPYTYTTALQFKFWVEETTTGSAFYNDILIDDVEIFDGSNPPGFATSPSPADGAVDVPVNGNLGWGAATLADGYYVYFGTDNPPTNILNGVDVGDVTSQAYTDLAGGTDHFWQVVPYNTFGSPTGCPVWSFTTFDTASGVLIGSADQTWNYPFSTFYMDARMQTIYLASEFGSGRTLESLKLNVNTLSGQILENVYIRLKHTSNNTLTAFDNADLVQVYHATNVTVATGWFEFIFDSNFTYNGIDNLLIDICIDNSSYTSDGATWAFTDTRANRSVSYRSDLSTGDLLNYVGGTPGNIANQIQFTGDIWTPDYGILAGTVTEFSPTDGPIENALITIGPYSTYSAIDGTYSIADIITGTYDVTCEADGYISETVTDVDIIVDQTTTQDFALTWSEIAVTPATISETLDPEGTSTGTFNIANNGTGDLEYSIQFTDTTPTDRLTPDPRIYQELGPQVARTEFSTTNEQSPYTTPHYKGTSPDAMGDILFEMDVQTITGEICLLGAEWTGTSWWVTSGGATGSGDPNNLFEIAPDGTLLNTYPQIATSAWGLRDLAYDGTYLYSGDDNGFYQIDPSDGSQTLLFTSTFGVIRALAMLPDGTFWTKSFGSAIYIFDIAGNIIWTGADPTSAYGAAYDSINDCVWVFEGTTANTPLTTFSQRDYINHTWTGVTMAVPLLTGLTDQIIGGAFFTDSYINGKACVGGLVQGTPNDMIFLQELQDVATWFELVGPASGTVAPGANVDITYNFDAADIWSVTKTGNINISNNANYTAPTEGDDYVVDVTLIVNDPAAAPAAATLIDPANNAVAIPLTYTFGWEVADYVDYTELQIKDVTGGGAITTYGPLTDETYEVTGFVEANDYEWQVISYNNVGNTASGWWAFRTIEFGNLDGTVTDGITDAPIQGALVSITDAEGTKTALTDEFGAYLIEDILIGTYDVTCTADGFHDYTAEVTITLNATTTHDITMLFAVIGVSPTNISVTVDPDQIDTQQMTISNTGTGDMDFAISFAELLLDNYEKPVAALTDYSRCSLDGRLEASPARSAAVSPSFDQTRDEVTINYDGPFSSSIGLTGGGTFMVAARFTADELAAYYDTYELLRGQIYLNSAVTSVIFKVWEGGSFGDPGLEVYSQDITASAVVGWNEHTLTTPVSINSGNEYWIGYEVSHVDATFPAGMDAGPAVAGKGGWIYFGGAWSEISGSGFDVNWNIRGIIDQTGLTWLTCNPLAGTVPAGGNVVVDVIFDSNGLYNTTKSAEIIIANNSNYSAPTEGDDFIVTAEMIVGHPTVAPGAPSDPIPADGAINVILQPTLSWTNNGIVYQSVVEYQETGGFLWTSLATYTGGETSYTFSSDLLLETSYSWRVTNTNPAGSTQSTWQFTTLTAEPVPPSNPDPAHLATDLGVDQILTWECVNADSFLVWFGEATETLVLVDTVYTASYTPDALNLSKTYEWQIDAYNSAGNTLGPVWQFSTFDISTWEYLIVDLVTTNSLSADGIHAALQTERAIGGILDFVPEYADFAHIPVSFLCLGVYSYGWHPLSEAEAAPFVTYLDNGNSLLMEGADTWAFDTPTALHPYFGINPISDGSSDLAQVDGVTNSWADGESAAYTGANNWIDRIEGNNPNAYEVFENIAAGYYCGVAHQPQPATDTDVYRTVGLSFELGGTNNSMVMAVYDFLLNGWTSVPPTTPQNLAISVTGGNVTLSWDAVASAAFYTVYSADAPDGIFASEGTVDTNSWTAAAAADKKFYTVTAGTPFPTDFVPARITKPTTNFSSEPRPDNRLRR